jgi:hypothetical protein
VSPWKSDAVPVADLAPFERARRRTLLLRVVLGGAALVLLALAVVVARGLGAPTEGVLPQGRSGVVVLDLSRSIGARPTEEIRKALGRIDSADDRLGLVVFSDTAYELLPPGSPGAELRPIERFFTPVPGTRKSNGDPTFPVSPWDESFRGGTRISTGMRVAWDALRRDGITNGAVLLISDLASEAGDLPSVVALGNAMHAADVPVRILALQPRPADRRLFARIFGAGAFVAEAEPLGEGGGFLHRIRGASSAPLPWALVVAALALLGVLAANELLCGRLGITEAVRSA